MDFFLYCTCWIRKFWAGIQTFLKNFLLKFCLPPGFRGRSFQWCYLFCKFPTSYSALGLENLPCNHLLLLIRRNSADIGHATLQEVFSMGLEIRLQER